ncbi:M56 family metallopeptidase [Aminipila terrae]|uniref:Peptidase, M56 family protein n=1 Tax=Aminipila terrae TaxID=2697030 RepID=A0A6P1MJ05_9FIRM|nr:M56 family metallopeptidase [Aminipila terrae]QHI71045.1 peptidase, M56 family protein [Aminipila terrae]
MNEILKVVFSLSLSGTILMTILFGLKPLYKHKMGKTWQYYIWLIVVVRMLLPFTPETTLIGSMFQHLEYRIQNTAEVTQPEKDTQSDFREEGAATTMEIENTQSKGKTASPEEYGIRGDLLLENLWVIWLAVALALLLRKITMYQSFVRYVWAGSVEVCDIDILNLLAESQEKLKIKKPIELYTNSLISSTILVGFLRPFIVIPNTEMKREEMQYIIKHELTHFKRLDIFYKWLVQLTICLHWFNPFVFFMGKEVNKCCELSCDEAVISSLDAREKVIYGNTLLSSLKLSGKYKDIHASIALTESAEQIKERLDAIMYYKKKSKWMIAMTIALTAFLCFSSTVCGAYARDYGASKTLPENKSSSYLSAPQIKENVPFDIVINADNCNIIVLQSTGKDFKYEYDKSLYNVSSKQQDDIFTINAKSLSKVANDSEGYTQDKRIRIYVPDYVYENIKIVGNYAGISVLPIDANIDLVNKNGAAGVYLGKGFSKKLNYYSSEGAGSIRLEEGMTDYSLKAKISSSSFAPGDDMWTYNHTRSYNYTSGNGSAVISLDIKKSSFSFVSYSGDETDIMKRLYDIVF